MGGGVPVYAYCISRLLLSLEQLEEVAYRTPEKNNGKRNLFAGKWEKRVDFRWAVFIQAERQISQTQIPHIFMIELGTFLLY